MATNDVESLCDKSVYIGGIRATHIHSNSKRKLIELLGLLYGSINEDLEIVVKQVSVC
jgi:hypothetical protein